MSIPNIEEMFKTVRAKAAQAQIVILRPDAQCLFLPALSKEAAPPEMVAAVERMIPPTSKRNVAVIAILLGR
jgi:hypothetical protein